MLSSLMWVGLVWSVEGLNKAKSQVKEIPSAWLPSSWDMMFFPLDLNRNISSSLIMSLLGRDWSYNIGSPSSHAFGLGWKLQWVPYIRTFKLQTFKDANVHLVPARSQNLCHQGQAWVKLQLALHLLLLTILQLCHLLPPLPPPVSNSSCLFTRCQPPYASCCTVLLYFSRYCTVRLKMFSLFFVCFLCIICVKRFIIINLLQYIQPVVLVGYLGSLCWTYEQIGLMNVLLEWNSLVCRGLTVYHWLYLVSSCWLANSRSGDLSASLILWANYL